MDNWITIADRLRAVKRAHEEYLFRAFVDRLIIGPMLLDRLAADLGAIRPGRSARGDARANMRRNMRDIPPVQDSRFQADDE
jgi:hypothetical protein